MWKEDKMVNKRKDIDLDEYEKEILDAYGNGKLKFLNPQVDYQ